MKEGKRNSDNKNNNSQRDHIDSNMDRLILRFNIAFQNANKYFQAVVSFISNNMLWSASLFLFVFSALIFYFLFNNLTDGGLLSTQILHTLGCSFQCSIS